MGRDLRYFLFLRGRAGGVEIHVSRKLAEARRAWLEALEENNTVAGLLHAGEDRPNADEVYALFRDGCLLLTETVRWLLPIALWQELFQLATLTHPEGRGMPVSIAASGWGYCLPKDARPASESTSTFAKPTPAPEPSLPSDPLQRAVHALPPDVQKWCVADLPLSVRTMNVLLSNVRSNDDSPRLQDLAPVTSQLALGWRNFGRTSFNELLRYLEELGAPEGAPEGGADLQGLPPVSLGVGARRARQRSISVEATSLIEAVECIWERMDSRDARVLQLRLGWTGEVHTLERIGSLLGLSRERVRQLESRNLEYFRSGWWVQKSLDVLTAALRDRDSALYLDELATEQPWFARGAEFGIFLSELLPVMSRNELQAAEILGRFVVCHRTFGGWGDLVADLLHTLTGRVHAKLTPEEVELVVESVLASRSVAELTPLMLATLAPRLQFANVMGAKTRTLVAVGQGYRAAVTAVLEEAETPLHFTEVARRSSQRLCRQLNSLKALSEVRRIGAKLFGRGVYGLRRHLALEPDQIRAIIEDAEYIICESSSERQWHASEILKVLEDIQPDLPEIVDQYTVDMLLDESSLVQSFGRMVWSRQANGSSPSKRIDIADAAERILERSGRPMNQSELVAEIRKARGIGSNELLWPTDRMARVAPGVFGLITRDFGLTDSQRRAAVDSVFESLVSRGRGIHTSEIPDLVTSLGLPVKTSGFMLMQLAALDPRMSLFHGELLGLTEWGGPRRLTAVAAADQLAREVLEPLSADDLLQKLEFLTERPLPRTSLSAYVLRAGFVYEEGTARWLPPSMLEADTMTSVDEAPDEDDLGPYEPAQDRKVSE